MRAAPYAPLTARVRKGSREAALILLDDTAAAGRFQALAEFYGVAAIGERADQGAVVGALGSEIRSPNERLPAAKLRRIFGLERTECSGRFRLAALGRNLHGVLAVRTRSCRRRG